MFEGRSDEAPVFVPDPEPDGDQQLVEPEPVDIGPSALAPARSGTVPAR